MALSPMMQQYFQIKQNYEDTILMFRLGDFYEMFFDDAKTASKELELVLTGRDCGEAERAPMCGVPFHSADGYIAKLVGKGYKVAICEQMEDPSTAKGIVRREVVRIVTPGTNLDIQALDETKNNYIMCVVYIADRYGIGAMEMTTAEIFADMKSTDVPRELQDELRELFERADFVKFAKFTASDEDNAGALPLAVRFVTSTYQTEVQEENKEGGE